MDVKITGTFQNFAGKKKYVAVAENGNKKRTGFGFTEDEAKETAMAAVERSKTKK